MAKYTIELRKLIQNDFDIGLKDYPIFDEEYRDTLNKKIINHYWMREIGFETAGAFKHYLNATMDEIMPYYNQLYKSALLEIDPLLTFDEVETKTKDSTQNGTTNSQSGTIRNSNGTSSTDSDVQYENLNVHSDTPQGQITESDIKANRYASSTDYTKYNTTDEATTNVYNDNSQDNSTLQSTSNAIRNDVDNKHRKGFNGRPIAELLLKYRETFLNIDKMIIEELNNLFMIIW